MGVMSTLAGLTGLLKGAGSVAEVVIGNKGKVEDAEHAEFIATLAQLSKEFEQERVGWFDSLINGLNRLPRPALACGTLGLFVYAMADPVGFSQRMVGLELVPDPLWWLLGAIVSFYFGARELHYLRDRRPQLDIGALREVTARQAEIEALRPAPVPGPGPDPARAPSPDPVREPALRPANDPAPAKKRAAVDANPALEEWLRLHG